LGCAFVVRTKVNREPSCREVRDQDLKSQIAGVHAANYGVYGARKVWLALNREGTTVARCTVERLMAELGVAGATRGKSRRTTIADPASARPSDAVYLDASTGRCSRFERCCPPYGSRSPVYWFNHRRLYEYCGDIRPSNWRWPTTLNNGDQPPAESSNRKVSGLAGAVQGVSGVIRVWAKPIHC
jgi:transposase InsO family protein